MTSMHSRYPDIVLQLKGVSPQDIIHWRSSNIQSGPECVALVIKSAHLFLVLTLLDLISVRIALISQDRRPLAPAAVAKMIVRREDNGIIDVEYVTVPFLLFF